MTEVTVGLLIIAAAATFSAWREMRGGNPADATLLGGFGAVASVASLAWLA